MKMNKNVKVAIYCVEAAPPKMFVLAVPIKAITCSLEHNALQNALLDPIYSSQLVSLVIPLSVQTVFNQTKFVVLVKANNYGMTIRAIVNVQRDHSTQRMVTIIIYFSF